MAAYDRPSEHTQPMFDLHILGPFELNGADGPLSLGAGAVQVLSFLALHPGSWSRAHVAGRLWPSSSESRARANLRNAVWYVETRAAGVLTKERDRLSIAPTVRCDIDEARALAIHLTSGSGPVRLPPNVAHRLAGELLPDLYDDWVTFERDRLRQLFLHALEIASELLAALGRHAEALDAALTAVALEPLRETAHRAAARVHLLEGNVAAARRQYATYSAMVEAELGVAPSCAFYDEVRSPG